MCVKIPGESSCRYTVNSDRSLEIEFNNSSNGSGLAFLFDPPIDTQDFSGLELNGSSTHSFKFLVEYKVREGNSLRVVEKSPPTTFPADTASIKIPITFDGVIDEIVLAFIQVGQSSKLEIESLRPGCKDDVGLIEKSLKATSPVNMRLEGTFLEDGQLAVSPDNRLYAIGSSLGIHIYDAQTKETVWFDGTRASSMAFSPDGRLFASGTQDGYVKIWEMSTTMQDPLTLSKHPDLVISLAFSSDGKLLASRSMDTVKLWEVATGKDVSTFTGYTSMALSPDGSLLALGNCAITEDNPVMGGTFKTCAAGEITLWDIGEGQPAREPLIGHAGDVDGLAFSPNGEFLASGSCSMGHLFSGNRYHRSPLYECDQGEVILWELSTWKNVRSLHGHVDSVRGLTFSPDGNLLVSGSCGKNEVSFYTVLVCTQGETIFWDVSTGHEVCVITEYPNNVNHVTFTSDRRLLVSMDGEDTILVPPFCTEGSPYIR